MKKEEPKIIIEIVPIKVIKKKQTLNKNKEINRARKEFEETNPLKRKEFIYSTYFQRIKSIIGPSWNKAVSKYFKGKRIPRHFKTDILIILNKMGKVIQVLLVNSCGNKELDDIAIDSMKDQVFPNPPKDLIESDGLIRIEWRYNII